MAEIIGDTACPSCRAKGRDSTGNHLILFADGNGYCNRCDIHYSKEELEDVEVTVNAAKAGEPEPYVGIPGEPGELRGVRADIAEVYNVVMDGDHQYYPICRDGVTIGYKVRYLDPDEHGGKKFGPSLGSGKGTDLFGQHLLSGGNKVFITEGELDAMSVAQVLWDSQDEEGRKKFGFPPCVSVPAGAGGARNAFSLHQKLLDNYKKIVIVPDADGEGKKVTEAAVEVFGREKVEVVELPLKDPNEMLRRGQGGMLRTRVLNSTMPTPEDVVFADDISLDDLMKPIVPGVYVPQYPNVSRKLHGFRYGEGAGELTVVVSGSGMGKTTFTKEVVYSLRCDHDLTVGEIRLEESSVRTVQSLIAIDNNVPVARLRETPDILSRSQWEASRAKVLGHHKVAMLDHFGSLASEKLVDHLKYLTYTVGCQFISLDHISMVVSGQKTSDERKDIDILMTHLAAFVETSGVSVVAVVHLRRPSGDVGYNEGAEINLNALRGSAGLEQLSHNVIALEGNQREGDGNKRTARVLKNREWGDIGFAEDLIYYPQTGRLKSNLV